MLQLKKQINKKTGRVLPSQIRSHIPLRSLGSRCHKLQAGAGLWVAACWEDTQGSASWGTAQSCWCCSYWRAVGWCSCKWQECRNQKKSVAQIRILFSQPSGPLTPSQEKGGNLPDTCRFKHGDLHHPSCRCAVSHDISTRTIFYSKHIYLVKLLLNSFEMVILTPALSCHWFVNHLFPYSFSLNYSNGHFA